MRSTPTAWIALLALTGLAESVSAHGGHAAQPISVIDPIVTHHALLEDELNLNLVGEHVLAVDWSAAMGSLELAYAVNDMLGVEVFLPFGAAWSTTGINGGLGDVELQIPKVSFVREYGLVMTTYVGLTLPTGSPSFGSRAWVAAPHVLADLGVGPVGLQANVALEVSSSGELAIELRGALSYSILTGAAGPDVLSLVVEGMGEVSMLGDGSFLAGLVGARLSLGAWSVALGAAVELAGDAPFDLRVLGQLGYHSSLNRTSR